MTFRQLPSFSLEPWQMAYGERAVLEGILSMLKPRVSVEIGRAEGGSLKRIAAHSGEVLSFDLVEPTAAVRELANVRMLSGDSHAMLPVELRSLEDRGVNVDFALVDGDHSAEGARKDMRDLLDANAVSQTIILAHDTLNQDVRAGLEEVDYDAYEKVAWVDLDFTAGYVANYSQRLGECWGGIGLIVVDATGKFVDGSSRRNDALFAQPPLVWPIAEWIQKHGPDAASALDQIEFVPDTSLRAAEDELARARTELARQRLLLDRMQRSVSWRITSPLRAAKRGLRKRLSA